jgi:hypothetical protein
MPEPLFTDSQRRFQDAHGTRALADRLEQVIVHDVFTPEDAAFIGAREFFFLSTVDQAGHPTVSYKGGAAGFVRVVENELIFPCYDGNGMFLSIGNIAADGRVGLLFIDFERPRRLRLQGLAKVEEAGDRRDYPGALAIVRVTPLQIFVNCPRYIHRHVKVETSEHVPDAEGCAPLARWKKIDVFQDVLPDADRARAEQEGLIDLVQAQADADAGRG